MRHVALGFALSLIAATANAEWLEASSDHFVIYSEQNEKTVQQFAERLERFHAAMTQVFGTQQAKPSPSNRVRIFVVGSGAEVRRISGTSNKIAVGMYRPRAGSSVALIPKLDERSQYELSGERILYHEYAHDFMYRALAGRVYPRWFVEGFAEFFSSVRFKDDGSVVLGAPASHRGWDLAWSRAVPIDILLAFDGGARDSQTNYDAFYGQSWVLFHYLQMAPERKGQLAKYLQLLASGEKDLAAAEGAFGGINKLDRDMDSYIKRRRLAVMVIDPAALSTGPISVRQLRAAEAEMMPTFMELKYGATREEATNLVPTAREIAARYPNDAAVLATLAKAELGAGNNDEAIAAADRAIAIDPANVDAYINKGYALAREVESGALPAEAWKDVRNLFIKANGIENDHPIPLMEFYLSYRRAGEAPTKNAIAGLEWAMELAPFDSQLRWLVAQQMIADSRLREAHRTLIPLAYNPHSSAQNNKALELLKEVEAKLEEEAEGSES